jgi:transcriptional regulator with XRE-family HTH domain
MPAKRGARETQMDQRRQELGLSWDDVAARADISRQTLLRIRKGENSFQRTIRNLESVLFWAHGSIHRIDNGGSPIEEVRGQAGTIDLPALDVSLTGHVDLPAQLRALRDRMGGPAFWQEIGKMADEENTDRPRQAGP